MKIEYIPNGDYQIPNLKMKEQPDEPLTKWGLMALDYLKETHESKLFLWEIHGEDRTRLLEIQDRAEKMFSNLVEQMMEIENVTEKLKAENQLEWVRQVNNIRQRAEEIVKEEVIYHI